MSVSDVLGRFFEERPIVIIPALSRALGGPNLAIIVQTVVAAQSDSASGVAWIKDEELSEATTIPIVALPGLRGQLRAMGVLDETTNDATGMTSVRIDVATIVALIEGEFAPQVPDGSLSDSLSLTSSPSKLLTNSPSLMVPSESDRRNDAERRFEEMAWEKGWTVTKRGWPDFLCQDESGVYFVVEVKPRHKTDDDMKTLKPDQVRALDLLSGLGLPCYVSDGDVLEAYDPAKHQSEKSKKRVERRERAHTVPDDFVPTDRTIQTVVRYPSVSTQDVRPETVKFVNHHQAKGTKFVDWQAAFRNWMLNQSRWRQERTNPAEDVIVVAEKLGISPDKRRELERKAARGDQSARRLLEGK